MKMITVKVTKEDIRVAKGRGMLSSASGCPIALAIKRALGITGYIAVFGDSWRPGMIDEGNKEMPLPRECLRFIRGDHQEPFTFRIKACMKAILPILCVLLMSCRQTPSTIGHTQGRDIVNHLTYLKDYKTNQCYAIVASRHIAEFRQNGFTVTWVPCTPEVEKQIERKQ